MSAIDDYLAGLDEPARAALDRVRLLVKAVVPDAEEGKSYGMPALRYNKKPLLGFLAAKTHLSVFPFSPEVIDAVRDRLDGFDLSKGTIRFAATHPLPDDLLQDIVRLRLAEISPPATGPR
jgi:uncharacterized protein YdhG (YjbR/CyaY superfamily)